MLRESAWHASVRLDNNSSLRRAIVPPPKRSRGPYLPGMQVYSWRAAERSYTPAQRGRPRRDRDR